MAKLNDHDYADRLTDIILYELNSAKKIYASEPDRMTILQRIENTNWCAMESLGVTV
ncbi:hypothetical protein D3C77_623700 [compost metagenome]